MITAQVLLVDDSPTQASTRSAILSRTGFQVLVAQQGAAALELLEDAELRASLRLVITDHYMPEMNGVEFVRALREILPELPVLVLSGFAEAESEYEDLDVSFRVKPFPPEEFIRLVKALVNGPEMRIA